MLLYKLHGSIRWYRTESGDYEASKLIFDDTNISLDTHQGAIPLILYPGRKLEYIEPTLDMLVELKRKLDDAKYVIVIGYSFKDDHLAKMFRYAAKRNPELHVFLIGPDAHRTYHEVLKRHIDIDFQHGNDHEDYNKGLPSKLEGRVICLPYKIEKIIDVLQYTYVKNLADAIRCKRKIANESPAGLDAWIDCLRRYIKCEHIEMTEKIIEEKIDFNTLMKIDYRLGGEILVKSFLNNLLWDTGKQKWLNKFREVMPISPEKIEIKFTVSDLYLQSKQSLEQDSSLGQKHFHFTSHFLKFTKSILFLRMKKHQKQPITMI